MPQYSGSENELSREVNRIVKSIFLSVCFTGAMALGVANAQQSFYLSENDCTSWSAHFKQILDAKPKEARLQIFSDNKNSIFIKDLLAETYGIALKNVDLKLDKMPPIPLKMSYLVDGVGKVWSLQTDRKSVV